VDDMGLVFTAFFIIGMLAAMVFAILVPFSLGWYMMFTCGTMKRKVFMIIFYAILIFLFIWLKMYNVKFG